MKKALAFLFLAYFYALADEPSFMPRLLDFDSLKIDLPKTPEEFMDPKLTYFKQFFQDSGKICPQRGILISEKTAAEFVFYKAGYERQAKELNLAKYMMHEYYSKAQAAETVYRSRIITLEKDVKRTWFERNQVYMGFGLGVLTALLTEWAVFQAK